MPPVLHVRAFDDNYVWLIRGRAQHEVAIVDPGDADPVREFLARHQLRPVAILCTHHHGDHVGGVTELLRHYPVPVYGPARERIAGKTHSLHDGATVELPELGIALRVLDIPGHTAGHIAFTGDAMVFSGDTLFSAGCGRLFEGTAAQMHTSLTKLAALPAETKVYCGHEYTVANLRFALAVEPDNAAARAHLTEAQRLRADDAPTLPSTIAMERSINPFLRCAEQAVRQAAAAHSGTELESETAVFAALRRWKDRFVG